LRERVVRRRLLQPLVVVVGPVVLESVVEVLDHVVGAGVGLLMVLHALRIFPEPPGKSSQIRMLDHGFMVELRPHLPVVAADDVPVQQVRIDFVNLARTPMSDTGGTIAVDVHRRLYPRFLPDASYHRSALAFEAARRSPTTDECVHDRRRIMDRNRVPRQHKAMKKIGKSDVIGQRGMSLIGGIVLSMGFMFYPTGGVEAGIDGFIELRDAETGEVAICCCRFRARRPSAIGCRGRPGRRSNSRAPTPTSNTGPRARHPSC
jgi:hypothetical protein